MFRPSAQCLLALQTLALASQLAQADTVTGIISQLDHDSATARAEDYGPRTSCQVNFIFSKHLGSCLVLLLGCVCLPCRHCF